MEALLLATTIFQRCKKRCFYTTVWKFRLPASSPPRTRTCVQVFNLRSTPPHFPRATFMFSPTSCPFHRNFIDRSLHQKHECVAIPEIFRMDTAQRKAMYLLAGEHLLNLFLMGFYVNQGFYEGKLLCHIYN